MGQSVLTFVRILELVMRAMFEWLLVLSIASAAVHFLGWSACFIIFGFILLGASFIHTL